MNTKPTKKDLVYKQIRKAIVLGALKPGEILNEADLSRQYGAGKTPTREALIVLAHEKLLEPIPRVGYMVSRPTIQDILETFHLRLILEVEAIGLAVEKITNEEIELLIRNNQEEQAIIAESGDNHTREKAYELNRDFHMIIAESSGNTRLAEYVLRLIEDMERMLAVDPYLAEPSQHLEILDSLKQRDKAGAQAAMRLHLEETRARILNRF